MVGWNTSALTYFLGKYVLRVLDHIKYISLGNLCLDKLAFREMLQNDFNAEALADELRRLMEDSHYRETMLSDYAAIRESLGGEGASRKVAARMVSILSGTED